MHAEGFPIGGAKLLPTTTCGRLYQIVVTVYVKAGIKDSAAFGSPKVKANKAWLITTVQCSVRTGL